MTLKPDLNPNITQLKESATLAINMKARAARAKGEDVCHFGFGQSPFAVHPRIQIALAKNAHQKDYLPTKGLPALCEAIADYHKEFFGYDFKSDMILTGPGSKELIFQALYILEGPVLVPAPSWVSYGPQINIRGKDIVPIITKRENSYKIQADELKATCQTQGNGQKVLILNNPSNPTGAVYSEDEVKGLAKVCREENVIVISDEIYALINFSGKPYKGFPLYYPEGSIITSGLSKSHAAGGYRFGFIAMPENMKELMKALCAMVSETYSAVSAPTQYAALEAYSGDYELITYVKQCTRIHKACGEYLQKRFVAMGLNCPEPQGAFYLFPDFTPFKEKLKAKGINNCSELCNFLFDHYRVAVLPGSDFYYPDDYFGCRVASVDYDGEAVYSASLKPYLKVEVKEFDFLDEAFVEKECPRLKEGADRIEKFLKSL